MNKEKAKMQAKQVSKDKEIFCTTEMPLAEVFHKMTELKCVCMPVVESPVHKNIIGTITEHDICRKLIEGGLNPQRISAGRVLNGDFTTVSGEASVEECAALLETNKTQRLFVVDENGAFIGILTENDLNLEKTAVNFETVITDLTGANALPTKTRIFF